MSIACLQVKALISKLTEEKQSAIQQNNRLQQELVIICCPLSELFCRSTNLRVLDIWVWFCFTLLLFFLTMEL